MTILIVLCMLLCTAVCGNQYAPADTEAYAEQEHPVLALSGSGTQADPYRIASGEDLLNLAAVVNDRENRFENTEIRRAYYQLTADISLNDCSNYDNWEECPPELSWTPIGYETTFEGHLDGDGHTISGLYIRQASEKFSNNQTGPFGLFGTITNGEIKDLNLEYAYVHASHTDGVGNMVSGILAGSAYSTVITDCHVSGVLVCEGGNCGGLVGSGHGEISDCSFSGQLIDRTAFVGGKLGGITGIGGTIRNCTSDAELFCGEPVDPAQEFPDFSIMGGIAGMFPELVENCVFSGNIRSGAAAGGITGYAGDGTVIRGCVNKGSVLSGKSDSAGGIAGNLQNVWNDSELRIENCTNHGSVNSLSTDTAGIGGIAGKIITKLTSPVIISGCVNEADLGGVIVGGIVGSVMQSEGNVRMEHCTNRGNILGEGFWCAGILGHVQNLDGSFRIDIDSCVNEGDITTDTNAGGIVCDAFANGQNSSKSLSITNCVNRGKLTSGGSNNYMGGILGADACAQIHVTIAGCKNEGDLEFTH